VPLAYQKSGDLSILSLSPGEAFIFSCQQQGNGNPKRKKFFDTLKDFFD
jgi:hypothetical protein